MRNKLLKLLNGVPREEIEEEVTKELNEWKFILEGLHGSVHPVYITRKKARIFLDFFVNTQGGIFRWIAPPGGEFVIDEVFVTGDDKNGILGVQIFR